MSRRAELRRARRLARRLPAVTDPRPPLPPPLPPGSVVNLEGRGEVFVRDQPGPPSAPPILLLHGWTATADSNWFGTFAVLEGRNRVLGVDHRGHGRGMRPEAAFSLEDCADDAAALLRQLGTGRAIVGGYSMGGPIACLLAQRHPDVVAGLVLGATALEWRATARERIVWRFLSVMEWTMRVGRTDKLVARFIRLAVEEHPEMEALGPWIAGELRRSNPHDVAQAGRALSLYDFRPHAGEIRVPCASVLTTEDRLVRPKKQRQLARAVRAEVVTIDADHDVPFTNARGFAEAFVEAVELVERRVERQAVRPADTPT